MSGGALSTEARSHAPIDLIAAKLGPPASPLTREVDRAALVDHLASTPEPVVTLTAAAGYGKTTVLRQWLEHDERPFAWVTVDESDNDPIACLRYLAAAIDSVDSLPAGVFDVLHAARPRSLGIPRLAQAFWSTSAPMVLVVDDVDRISSRESLDAIALLCASVPTGSTVVLSGRSEPLASLGSLRTRTRVLEVGVEQLSLDLEETATLLELAGLRLSTAEVEDLWQRTEGWAAGLYLAALALRSGMARGDVHELRGDDPYIGDFFRDQLLGRLSPEDARFLVDTSVLERLSGSLCDAVLEQSGSDGTLDRLKRSNQFVVPLDRHGDWYRYHQLFRDLLAQELRRDGQSRVRELNRRAATWWFTTGDLETAIRHATDAADLELLDTLIQRAAGPARDSGRTASIEEWLQPFDDDAKLETHVPVAVIGAWIYALSERPDEAERWLRIAERGADGYTGELVDGSASVASWVAAIRAGFCAEGPEQMRADSQRALAELAEDSPWRRFAQLFSGCAARLLDDVETAEREWSAALAQPDQSDLVGAQLLGQLAVLALERGNVSSARELIARAQAAPGPEFGTDASQTLALAALARIALIDNDRERASRLLTRSQNLRPLLTWARPWLAVQVRLELAQVALALLDEVACRTLLTEIKAVQARRPALGTLGDRIDQLEERVRALKTDTWNWAASLTPAELRLLPLLATHLTFDEIGSRLFVSRHTVKSHAAAVYRKLGVSSRGEAVDTAVELGLLEASVLERTLTESRPRADDGHRILLEMVPDAVISVDARGTIVLVNSQTESVFGYSRDELVGSGMEMLLPDAVRARSASHRKADPGSPRTRRMGVGLDLRGRRADGSEFPVDVSLSASDTDQGRLVTAFVRDLTERRQAESFQQSLRELLREASTVS